MLLINEVISGAKAFIFIWKKIPKYKCYLRLLELKIFLFFNLSYEIVSFFIVY